MTRNSTEKWLQVSIGPSNGLVPYRHQAITWTNTDQDLWYYMALIKTLIEMNQPIYS